MSIIKCCFEPVELPEFIETMVQKCTDPGCKFYVLLSIQIVFKVLFFVYLKFKLIYF